MTILKQNVGCHVFSKVCNSDDFNIDRAPWRFVMVPNEIHGHFVFMDINQDGLISSSEYYSVHRVFNYLGYSKYDKHNYM